MRFKLLHQITNDIDYLIKSSNGQCSVIFVYENIQVEEEQSLVITLLTPTILDFIWKPKFMRIAECIVGTFRSSLVQFLIEYIILKMNLFIKSRDGYFLLRTVIKTTKSPNIQLSIIKGIESNFIEFVGNSNGALLIQCIIHNFALYNFAYIKSCSRHLNLEDEQATTIDQKRQQSNPALDMLFQILLDNIKEWDNKNIKPIVECSIKVGGKQFEKLFIMKITNSNWIKVLILSSYGMNYIKLLSKHFEKKSINLILSSISMSLRSVDTQTQLRWKKCVISNDSTKNDSVNSNNKTPVLSNNELTTNSSNKRFSLYCQPHQSCPINYYPFLSNSGNKLVSNSQYYNNDQSFCTSGTASTLRPLQPILVQSCPNIYYSSYNFTSPNASLVNTNQYNNFSALSNGSIGYLQPYSSSLYSTGSVANMPSSMISYSPSYSIPNNSQILSHFNSQTENSSTTKSSNSSTKSKKYYKHDK